MLSTLHSHDSRTAFRNAGLVARTLLIRVSPTLEKPYDVGLGIVAMAFGTLVLLVHPYVPRIGDPRTPSTLELPG